MKDVFDLYEWNKKRYLGELNINKDIEGSSLNITRGGDNPKIGAELESDKNVVGENKEFLEYNKDLIAKGLKPAEASPLLLGITKASLQTKSFIFCRIFSRNH